MKFILQFTQFAFTFLKNINRNLHRVVKMYDKKIKAICERNGIEEEIEIPVLSILSVNEIWEFRQEKNPDGTLQNKRQVYLGTHIASRNGFGWMVKERAKAIEDRIDFAAKRNKHYNGQCNCWGSREAPIHCAGSMYLEKRKRKAS